MSVYEEALQAATALYGEEDENLPEGENTQEASGTGNVEENN